VLGNKWALELHQHLLDLLEWLAGDEHGREELAPSGGGHGGEEHAVVRGGREGGLSRCSSSGRAGRRVGPCVASGGAGGDGGTLWPKPFCWCPVQVNFSPKI
jgi:hypothetical protein